eukprot:NODE_189_length_15604_cov_0.314802.p5 type:complete len:153 gc:universal NODE_189_length_15604_cov_0.314802:8492-8950(+)
MSETQNEQTQLNNIKGKILQNIIQQYDQYLQTWTDRSIVLNDIWELNLRTKEREDAGFMPNQNIYKHPRYNNTNSTEQLEHRQKMEKMDLEYQKDQQANTQFQQKLTTLRQRAKYRLELIDELSITYDNVVGLVEMTSDSSHSQKDGILVNQ